MKLTHIVNEATVFSGDESVEELIQMLDGAKRGLSIMNKIRDKQQRKKHASAIFSNMNRIRAKLAAIIKSMDEPSVSSPPSWRDGMPAQSRFN